MSDHIFKTNFTDLSEENVTLQENYDSPANVRNVVFVLSNGNEVMRNYLYLVSTDLHKSGEKNLLEVGFTSDTILIEGYSLFLLRDKFKFHFPKVVMPSSERYIQCNSVEYIISNIKMKI